ncbi:lysophospholipid acyltransferase family protein [Cryptosporangium phraense]|uniref:Lysophospholipid acyltransferase family protein n=1 Tax=Cryptosporangium phraense TaxID=2593070 RepID=A0A545AKT8_9ACTN|nr:lysophospholipid acyltransferase family protein [Cryptosporangium phraense]TQS41880.1 lysophospholipid acyltransferase family protein [Cryptosporangium phraense]
MSVSSAYWVVRSGVAVAGRTPPRVRHGLASAVTSASYAGWRSKRRFTQENMATVLGLPPDHPRVRRTALRSWSNYGRTAAGLICLPYVDMADVDARTHDLTDDRTWRENLQDAMAPGRGALIATGHFGSWDLAGAIAARHVPLSAIADTFSDPGINRLLQSHRRDKQVEIIPVEGAVRKVLRELKEARAVAIVIDRPVTRERGVEVTFFGRRTYVPAGAAAMAVKSGAAIMPGYVWYAARGHYNIRAFPPIFPRPVHGAEERAQEIQRLTQYLFDCQEAVVRQCPTQWFMFRRFWPAGSDASAEGGAEVRAA